LDLILPLRFSGPIDLRLDYLWGTYKRSPCEYCGGYGFRVLSVGPEVVLLRDHLLRPYLNAAYGRISFESNTEFSFADPNRHTTHTGTNALIYGGGVRIDTKIKRNYFSRWTVDLDLGLRSYNTGSVSYHNQNIPYNGIVTYSFARSRTPFFMYTMGLQFRYDTARP
jgi:hypothetical protein